VDEAIERLEALKELGVRLAVDDFGTGYSSLSYLRRLPVDNVKIDRSFVNAMGEDAEPAAIVQTIIMLCRALGLDVTGEGIEDSDQLIQLQSFGCQFGQGYHFSKPVSAEAFEEIIKAGPLEDVRDEVEIEKRLNLFIQQHAERAA
jgi:EAL domain-containing protein (putative c-di-GMP-specific phosphodiesterase class I)